MIIGRYLTQINHLSLKGFILYKKVYATFFYIILLKIERHQNNSHKPILYIKTYPLLCQEAIREYFFRLI